MILDSMSEEKQNHLISAYGRLVDNKEMGSIYKVLAVTCNEGNATPYGFVPIQGVEYPPTDDEDEVEDSPVSTDGDKGRKE